MAPVMADPSIVTAASKLVISLQQVQSIENHSPIISQEIEHFIKSLNENIDLLKQQVPNKRSVALESLEQDLNAATSYLEGKLKDGSFQQYWDAKPIKDQLERLRQNLINQLQVKLFITNLEVAIDANKKMDDFESRMAELSSLSIANASAASADIRKLLQPLVVDLRKEDQKIQSFTSTARQNKSQVETPMETQNFVENVLANLEDAVEEESARLKTSDDHDREGYLDPITKELMIDPVKCNDGETYDRFTVFENNVQSQGTAQLVIVCDDESVRRGLFKKFPEDDVETKFHLQRKFYREEALKLATAGQHAEAALSMLSNVLQWAPYDKECREKRDDLQLQLDHDKMKPMVDNFSYVQPAPPVRVAPYVHSMPAPPSQVRAAPYVHSMPAPPSQVRAAPYVHSMPTQPYPGPQVRVAPYVQPMAAPPSPGPQIRAAPYVHSIPTQPYPGPHVRVAPFVQSMPAPPYPGPQVRDAPYVQSMQAPSSPGPLQETVTAAIRVAERVNWDRVEEIARCAIGVVVLIACFPCSLYSLSCLFPNACEGTCCGGSKKVREGSHVRDRYPSMSTT